MNKKLILAVIMWAILATLVWCGLRRWMGQTAPPPAALARKTTLIDIETLELITMSSQEWLELGSIEVANNILYKNPTTGKHTASLVMECASCGESVPWVGSDAEDKTCPRCGGSILE